DLRWEKGIYNDKTRSRAISEVREALRALEPLRPHKRKRHAQLSVLLAELLDAHGEHEAATAAVDNVSLTALTALDVGLVRHTRAVTHLRAGDAQGALGALEHREPTGDAELDQ